MEIMVFPCGSWHKRLPRKLIMEDDGDAWAEWENEEKVGQECVINSRKIIQLAVAEEWRQDVGQQRGRHVGHDQPCGPAT